MQVLIGSSMGGWLGLMLARARPERVKALIGIAAAPDFTEDLMWLRLSPDQRAELESCGEIRDPTAPPGCASAGDFAPDRGGAGSHLLLRAKVIRLQCPVHLLQGLHD